MSSRTVEPLRFSIGGWCLINPGGDPFGDSVRNITLPRALEILANSPIKKVSFHDRDLWPDNASMPEIQAAIATVQQQVDTLGLQVFNFTANLFSNPCFRSGAFSSPFPDVRKAAILKGTRAIDAADVFGAQNIIWWGGREGTDGAYEQDPGVGLRRYMQGLRTCVVYGHQKGYDFVHTIEPKVYEPRLLGLYAGTGTSAASAIKQFFPEPHLFSLVKINPEYPQHVAMLGLDPVLELGQLLEEDMLADFIHFGGQISGRMDCDLPPGFGGNFLTDFMICLTLHRRNWQGVVEFDCRPPRTTTTEDGLLQFLRNAVDYWRRLERMVEFYFNDDEAQGLEAEMDRTLPELDAVIVASEEADVADVVGAVEVMRSGFTGFESANSVNTDIIEAYQRRVRQIVMGQV